MTGSRRIHGYHFSSASVAEILTHNRNLAAGKVAAHVGPRIGMVFLSVPPVCNLQCPYCYTDSRTESSTTLKAWELEHVVAACAELGAKSVIVAGEGEPFIMPDIWTIIAAAETHGLTCVVFTNGTLITPEVASGLFERHVSIILKVNSFRPQVQDRLVGVEGAHKAIYAAIDSLLSAGFRAPRFALQSAIMRPILSDLHEVFMFCRTRSIVPYIETFVAMGKGARESVRQELEPDRAEVEHFFAALQEIDRRRFGIEWPASNAMRVVGYGACNKSQIAVTVRANGDVFRCITESIRLGNIRQADLGDIMRSHVVVRSLVDGRCSGCASQRLVCSSAQRASGEGVLNV